MKQRLYEKFDGSAVTESMLLESSQLFNENYGVWSEQAARLIGKFAQAGKFGSRWFCFACQKSLGSHVHTGSAGESFEQITCPMTPHAHT